MNSLITSPSRSFGREEIATIRARVEVAMAGANGTDVHVVVGDHELPLNENHNGSNGNGARRVLVLGWGHHEISRHLSHGVIRGIVDADDVERALAPTIQAVEHELNAAPLARRLQIAPPAFSHREWCVLRLLAGGHGNTAIAAELGIEATTVKSHVSSVCLKLGVRSRIDAARMLEKAGHAAPGGATLTPIRRRFRPLSAPIETDELQVLVISEGRGRAGAAAGALRQNFANVVEAGVSDAASLEPPDVLVVDVRGDSIKRSILSWRRRMRPDALVALVPDDRSTIRQALGAGVDGVVLAGDIQRSIESTVEAVAAGQLVAPLGTFNPEEPRIAMTDRQEQVLHLANSGLTNDEIAGRLNLASSTVKSHLSSSYRKLNVTSRSEAAALLGQESRTRAQA